MKKITTKTKNKKEEIKMPKTKIQKLKLKHKKLFIIAGALLLVLLALFLLTGNKEKLETSNNKTTTTTKKVEEKKEVKIVNLNSKTRPYAVMINNVSTARPLQSGLQDAFIIYEMIVEGGITRYLALFQDTNTERIGSIRSARHYYLDYA